MSNALVHVTFTVDVAEGTIAVLMGRSDDGSDDYYEAATHKVEEWVLDNYMDVLACAGEPEVEALA